VGEHLRLVATALVIVVVVALGLGILLTRRRLRWLSPLATGLANLGQATPAIGLLVLLSLWLGVGFWTGVAGLVAATMLPALRNTMAGLRQVDRRFVESALGMGGSPLRVLLLVELPLATPVILAGLRTAAVVAVSVATLATFVDAGGLGDMIVNGIKLQRIPVLVTGAVLTAVLAILVDWLGRLVGTLLRRRV
jgi:osmoprotectant transport system permease protein